MTEEGERYLELGHQGAITTEVMLWAVAITFAIAFTFPVWKYLFHFPPPDNGRRKRR